LAAISAAMKLGRSIPGLGKAYKIAESTVRFYMRASVRSSAGLDRKATVTADHEHELAEHVFRLVKLVFGVIPIELRRFCILFRRRIQLS